MKNITIEDLSWNKSLEIQEEAIKYYMLKINDIKDLILPPDKTSWENCARIIITYNDDILKEYFSKLLEWLQDPNWPGFILILNRLCEVADDSCIELVENDMRSALRDSDDTWANGLSSFLSQSAIGKSIDVKLYERLKLLTER